MEWASIANNLKKKKKKKTMIEYLVHIVVYITIVYKCINPFSNKNPKKKSLVTITQHKHIDFNNVELR